MAYALDTLQTVKKLREVKFSKEQAEAITSILTSDEGLATKADLKAMEERLMYKIGGIMFAILSAFEILKTYIGG